MHARSTVKTFALRIKRVVCNKLKMRRDWTVQKRAIIKMNNNGDYNGCYILAEKLVTNLNRQKEGGKKKYLGQNYKLNKY